MLKNFLFELVIRVSFVSNDLPLLGIISDGDVIKFCQSPLQIKVI